MQYLQRSTKQEVLQLQRNRESYFTLCGEKKPSLKNSSTPGKLSQIPPAEVLIIGCDRHPELPVMVKI